jgi:hypothetical protein
LLNEAPMVLIISADADSSANRKEIIFSAH